MNKVIVTEKDKSAKGVIFNHNPSLKCDNESLDKLWR